MAYKSYNRLYYKGKAVGRPFLTNVYSAAEGRASAVKKAKENVSFHNRRNRGKGYSFKLVKVVKR